MKKAFLIAIFISSFSFAQRFETNANPKVSEIQKNFKFKHYSKINDSLENIMYEDLESFEDLQEDFQEAIFEIFVELKKKHFCTDLVDYLIAQMYCNQLIANNLDETNQIIGIEMMKTLVLIKNRYAIRYFKIIVDLFDK